MRIREAMPEDAPGIARVHVSAWRETYRGIVPETFLDNLSEERQEKYWEGLLSEADDKTIVLVADHPYKGVVGFASAGPERSGKYPYQAELYTIYMLRLYQGRGLGRNLVASISACLVEQGMTSLLVWVLRDNLFRAFYEALGGQEVGQQDITIGDSSLVEIAYGWEDIRPLVSGGDYP